MSVSWTPSDAPRQRSWRGLILSWLVMGGMLLVCVCGIAWGGMQFLRAGGGVPVRLSKLDIQPGECFNRTDSRFIPIINCDDPHDYEAYAYIPFLVESNREYVGTEYVNSYGSGQCNISFPGYFGAAPDETGLELRQVVPNEAAWEEDRRNVVCYVGATDGSKLSQSLRGATSALPAPVAVGGKIKSDIAEAGAVVGDVEIEDYQFPDVEIGSCLNIEEITEGETTTGDVVEADCEEPHQLEVFALPVVPTEDNAYPGEDAVLTFSNEACGSQFESYVGITDEESTLSFTYYYPTAGGWASDQRDVICTVYNENGDTLTGSMENSGDLTKLGDQVPIANLNVGECYVDQEYRYELNAQVLLTDCTNYHSDEVFAIQALPYDSTAPYPNYDELIAYGDAFCQAEFETYVGLPYDDSFLIYYTLEPSEDEWASGERRQFCLLYDSGGDQLDFSARDSGEITAILARYPDSEIINALALNTGDCFRDPKSFDTDQVLHLSCVEPHNNEVFATVDYPADAAAPYPDELYGVAQAACEPQFEGFVGIAYENSVLGIYILPPTAEQWSAGERKVVCALYSEDYFELYDTFKDTGDLTAYEAETVTGERVARRDLQVGDCYALPNNSDKSDDVLKVACDTPHGYEVFARQPLTDVGDTHPETIDDAADALCQANVNFEAYVGIPYVRSTLEVASQSPTGEQWAANDRDIVCAVFNGDFSDLTVSVAGSGQQTAYPPDDVTGGQRITERALDVGACFISPANYYKTHEVLQVSCDAPHDSEVYSRFSYPGAPAEIPSPADLNSVGDTQCVTDFGTYVGISYAESAYGYSISYPDTAIWQSGDTDIICILNTYDLVEGTVQGSGQ